MLLSEVVIVVFSNSLEDEEGSGEKTRQLQEELQFIEIKLMCKNSQRHSNDGGAHTGASAARD